MHESSRQLLLSPGVANVFLSDTAPGAFWLEEVERMRHRIEHSILRTAALLLLATWTAVGCRVGPESVVSNDTERQGREIFRYDTFGDEQFWTDTARLHEVIDRSEERRVG